MSIEIDLWNKQWELDPRPTRKCANCGRMWPHPANFCGYCGMRLINKEVVIKILKDEKLNV